MAPIGSTLPVSSSTGRFCVCESCVPQFVCLQTACRNKISQWCGDAGPLPLTNGEQGWMGGRLICSPEMVQGEHWIKHSPASHRDALKHVSVKKKERKR
jgi:hypothetical protein